MLIAIPVVAEASNPGRDSWDTALFSFSFFFIRA